MKIVIAIVILLIVLIGAGYGLLRYHMIPTAMLAKSPPMVCKLLTQMKLYTPPTKKAAVAAVAAPAVDPLAAEKQQLEQSQAEVDREKASLQKKITAAAAAPPPVQIAQTSPQLIEIYEEMNSGALATIFAKEPDSAVVSALIGMETKKAAKALAAIPPDRAAKITALMNQAMANAPSTPQPTAS